MTEKRLKQIEEKLSHPKVELHGSIGLQNVNERLRASFGSSYYMSLENNETGGLDRFYYIQGGMSVYQVLLVDDEYMILNGLKKIIDWQSLGFQIVATAENAKEGLAVLEQRQIDLVVTDVTMPEINGLEFIEAAQKNVIILNL